MDIQNLWQTVLADIKPQVTLAVYQLLRSQTSLLSFEGDVATVGCHKPMLIPMIEGRYAPVLKKSLDEYTKLDTKLVFVQKIMETSTHTPEPLFHLPPQPETFKLPPRFNIDYTFDNFAVSGSNQMAYAAATAVAKSPGTSYNPLFIYGGVGVGKTHLMQAIGHVILKQNPHTRAIYCTGEEFTNEIVEAIGNKTTTKFKKKYRQVDMLLMDDIQFIAGKYAIQEEFFHTFNSIHQTKGQVVLTSDRPPEEINKLEERLRSRFQGGLTIDIGPADFELRTAILFIKAKHRGIALSMEHARLIAANVDNTRKLEGVFVRIITEAQLRSVPITDELIKSIVGKTVKESPKNSVEPQAVVNAVAAFYDLKLSALKSEKRDKYLSVPRQIVYYILRNELGIPLMDIGALLGGRDHTTIMHGVRKISDLLSTNEKIREDILGIKTKLFG
jgi:chromosomal replication initiator protein